MWPGPYGEWGSRKSLVASLDRSLQRMGLEYVDIFYHLRPSRRDFFSKSHECGTRAVLEKMRQRPEGFCQEHSFSETMLESVKINGLLLIGSFSKNLIPSASGSGFWLGCPQGRLSNVGVTE